MLIKASEVTQLIVTTHSDILVDALSNNPDTVIICEKGELGTELHHLNTESLNIWLTNYSLGQLWRKGEIGGNRW
jgi:predicted ATPase